MANEGEDKKMSEEPSEMDRAWRASSALIGALFALIIAVLAGMALFGGWFEASKSVMEGTAEAREELASALYMVFGEFGKCEVRQDYSVRAYISKHSYMQIPYPDRDKAITSVCKVWCKGNGVEWWHLPKVVLRDIQTGENLASYGCLTGWVSKN
jgi:hypothetical protein